jgi:hypothetical protein
VTRRDCCKGCQGNVLRSLQRFGRLGKRSWGDNGKAPEPAASTAMKVRCEGPRWPLLPLPGCIGGSACCCPAASARTRQPARAHHTFGPLLASPQSGRWPWPPFFFWAGPEVHVCVP